MQKNIWDLKKILIINLVLGIFIVVNLIVAAANQNNLIEDDKRMNNTNEVITTLQYEGVILTDPRVCDWIPSEALVAEFEEGLVQFLAQINNAGHSQTSERDAEKLQFVLANLPNYKRQYMGKIIDGRKVLYCNFLTLLDDQMRDNWKKNYLVIHDGGAYFFNVMYDIQTKVVFDLMINGEA